MNLSIFHRFGEYHTPTCSTKLLGTRDTTFGFFVFSSLSCILHIWGVCYFNARCLNRVLPPAGQNPEKSCVSTGFCLRRVRIVENYVFLMYLRQSMGPGVASLWLTLWLLGRPLQAQWPTALYRHPTPIPFFLLSRVGVTVVLLQAAWPEYAHTFTALFQPPKHACVGVLQ